MPKTTLERPKSNEETGVRASGGDGDECGGGGNEKEEERER